MYKPEAELNLGNLAKAASIINSGTRVERGKLQPVEANANEIKQAIHYENMVEFPLNTMGIGFFDMRKENMLQSGTLLHFPIPGNALEAIPSEYYTYGGNEGVAGQDYSSSGWR